MTMMGFGFITPLNKAGYFLGGNRGITRGPGGPLKFPSLRGDDSDEDELPEMKRDVAQVGADCF